MNRYYAGTYGVDKPCRVPGQAHHWHRAGFLGALAARRQRWRCYICGVTTTIPPPVPPDRMQRYTPA